MNYEIVRYRPELRPGVVAIHKHLVSSDPALNDAYFQWKHERNPYTAAPIVYVALANGDVAGMRAFQGARWHFGDNAGTASWLCACDLVVDPAHRNQKLFRRIMDFALADLAAQGVGPILNWSANPITYGASLRSGWHLVAPYVTWARQTTRARRTRALAARMRRWPLAWRYTDLPARLALRPGFDAMDAAWSSRSEKPTALKLTQQPRFEAMAALAKRMSARLVRHERDATYFRWRLANPICDYRFLYWEDSALEGFLVLQVRRLGDGADINVVDWESSTPEIFEAMLSSLVEIGGYDTLSIWSATRPGAIKTILQRLGLEPIDT
jgi:GNAT superfamily N-acetyltransferase